MFVKKINKWLNEKKKIMRFFSLSFFQNFWMQAKNLFDVCDLIFDDHANILVSMIHLKFLVSMKTEVFSKINKFNWNFFSRDLDESSVIKKEDARVYDTVTFKGPPMQKQRLWPRHCVQDSWGAELHKDLKIVPHGVKVYKGTNPEVDSYSVFWDNKRLSETTLSSQLQKLGISDIYVCGVAYDVCVGATAVDALKSGYRTILVDDCCRGVDLVDIEKTKSTVIADNGVIISSCQVLPMVEGKDRRPELGLKLAMEIKKNKKTSCDVNKNGNKNM